MTTATITGPIYSVSQVYDFISMSIVFELSRWDQEENVGLYASGPVIVPVDENGEFSVNLFVNSEGTQETHYQCFLQYRRTDGTEWIREPIGIFTLTSAGTFALSDLEITPLEQKVISTLDVHSLAKSYLTEGNQAYLLSQAWAESPTEPDGPGTKSAKTSAEEAALLVAEANAALNAAQNTVLHTQDPPLADADFRKTGGSTILLGDTKEQQTEGENLGRVLFHNNDKSVGSSGRRIGAAIKAEASNAFGGTDLILSTGTTDPIGSFDDPADYSDNTIERLRIQDTGATLWEGEEFKFPTPTVYRRRYAVLSDYAPTDGSSNAHAGTQQFFNENAGREMVINVPYGNSTQIYRYTDRSDGMLNLPKIGRVIWEPGALSDFSGWGDGTSTVAMGVIGAPGTSTDLQETAAKGDAIIYIGEPQYSTVNPGDVIFIKSNDNFTLEELPTDQSPVDLGKKGEYAVVVEKFRYTPPGSVERTALRLMHGLQDSYTAGGNTVVRRDAGNYVDLILDNPTMIGYGQRDAGTGDRGFLVANAKHLQVNGGSLRGFDMMGILASAVMRGKIDGLSVHMMDRQANVDTSYGIAIANATNKFDVVNCEAFGGREAMCLTVTGDSWGNLGVSRGVTFKNNTAKGARRSGYATHDNHEDLLFEGNRAFGCEQGFDCRIRDATFIGNIIKHTGTYNGSLDCGFQIGSGGGKLRFFNNYMEDVLRGHWMPGAIDHEVAPGDILIDGDVIRSTKPGYGTLMDFQGSARVDATAQLGKLTVKNVDYEIGAGGGSRGVQARGKWDRPHVHGRFYGGNGAQVVYLAQTTGGGGSDGPVSPLVDVEYGGGFAAPLITNSTGVVDTRLRGIGFYAPGQQFQTNYYLTIPSLAPGQATQLGADISGVAVGDNIQVSPNSPDPYIDISAYPDAAGHVLFTVHNVGSSTRNPTNGQMYLTITKRL